MPEVPRVNTPATLEDVSRALRRAGISGRQLCYLRAHVAIETAQGRSIQNHNVGNLSARDTGLAPFWRPTWFRVDDSSSERDKRLHELMLAGREPSAFRAYPSLEAGVGDYVSLLRRRFQSMLRARTRREFVQQWRDSGYTPALNVEATLRTFKQLTPCGDGGGTLLPLAALGIGGYLIWRRLSA